MRGEEECERAIDRYADMVRRICLVHLRNAEETEDIFQNVLIRYMQHDGQFEDDEHEKAWMIRVPLNACKDQLRFWFRHRTTPLEAVAELSIEEDRHSEVLEAVLSLPEKYRDAIYLHYYDGYTARQIGEILHRSENTVYSLLSRGRDLLRTILGDDDRET